MDKDQHIASCDSFGGAAILGDQHAVVDHRFDLIGNRFGQKHGVVFWAGPIHRRVPRGVAFLFRDGQGGPQVHTPGQGVFEGDMRLPLKPGAVLIGKHCIDQ